MSDSESKSGITTSIAVALITGMCASIPGILSFVNTPKQIEAELSKVREQNETQIQLQRDQTVAEFLARLDDPAPHIRSGAALSLSALGGDTIVPVLVGKLQEAVAEGAQADVSKVASLDEKGQRQFVNALKQSLFAIGPPALKDLLHLNRDITPAMKQALASRAKARETIRNMSEAQQEEVAREFLMLETTAREVKDVIRAILFKLANLSVAPPGKPSPLLEYGISLSHADLSRLRLIRLNLSGVNLSFADLRGASLEESYCAETRFDGALLKDVLFLQGVFDGAKFRDALIMSPAPYFGESSFKGADFTGARIEDRGFSEYLRSGGALNVRYVSEETPIK
jgi:Pentapeptide repeats (8 copies)